jgi:UDP-N-acetylglucosamine 3-dehydrogenase
MKCRVVVIGNGSMGKNHVRVLQNSSNHVLVGIYDSQDSATYGINENLRLSALSEILEVEPDYVVVATPTDTHFDLTCTLLEMGLNVLVEKPLASNEKQSTKMLELMQHHGVIGAVGHIERFNSASIRAREMIKDGTIGSIISISTIRQSPTPVRIVDAGVILDLLTHDIDLVQWLCDSSYKWTEVIGKKELVSEKESLVFAIAELFSGVLINHNVNWLSPFKERKIQIIGSEGVLEINTLTSTLKHFKSAHQSISDPSIARILGISIGEVIEVAFNKKEALEEEHEQMLKAISCLPNEISTFSEGCGVVKVAESMTKKLMRS